MRIGKENLNMHICWDIRDGFVCMRCLYLEQIKFIFSPNYPNSQGSILKGQEEHLFFFHYATIFVKILKIYTFRVKHDIILNVLVCGHMYFYICKCKILFS